MDDGYGNPITLEDKLLARFAFSSCHMWLLKSKKSPKIALEIHSGVEGGAYKSPK